ncbi:hypothetical protein DM860_017000 [Cuscuta australis]|uniref:Uncharacterized protein n=1 Tax=Cuscuta australis TaxID=267555 RepID=A0A328DNC7_9ASTE|nr:hypothetical protein DM860_017000 [Cuscuta australis]
MVKYWRSTYRFTTMMVITAEEKLEGGGAEYDELQPSAILHPKVVDGRELSISVDYLPCFNDGMAGGGNILASCDNLILCSPRKNYVDEGVYDLCNPYTKQ